MTRSAPSGEWYWLAVFYPPRTCLTPYSGWTPCDINVTYTSLKSSWATIPSLTIRVYLHSFSCYCLRNTRNSTRIRPYNSPRSCKVIDLGVNGKPILCNLLLVINCNFIRICYRFRDSGLKIENYWFYPPLPCLTPSSGRMSWDINVIYRLIKSTFNGLQFRRWHYRSVFIRLAVVASQNREIRRNSEKLTLQQFKVIQCHRSWCQSKAHMRHSISD